MSTDRIEKQIVLRAPLARVWQALSDSQEFGKWFGMKLDGPFVAGKTMRGAIEPTVAIAEVAKKQEAYRGTPVELVIERIEPQKLLSMRWHPYAIEPGVDYSAEPMTLIEFTLQETPEGVLLTVTESGFDQIPESRRAKAFKANEGGWSLQVNMIEAYLAQQGTHA